MKNPFSLAKLRRQTTGRTYLPEVDGLRFLAILSVVLFHISVQVQNQPYGKPIFAVLDPVVHHPPGVQMFFVLSGFILGLPFARHRLTGAPILPLRAYFLRRLTRLEPPYAAVMLLRAALLAAVMRQPLRLILPHLLATLCYVHSMVYGASSSIDPPVWSLEVEVQFYLLAPFLAWILFSCRRSTLLRRVLFLALILGAGMTQQFLWVEGDRLKLSIADSLQYFLAGFLLCDLYLMSWEKIRSHWLWDAAALPLWAWAFWGQGAWYRILLPLVCVALYVGAIKGPAQRVFFRNPAIGTVGGMGYSIFLTHNLLLTPLTALFRPIAARPTVVGVWLISLLIALIVFAAGLVCYVVLERPCMDREWPRKFAIRLRLREPEPASLPARAGSLRYSE